MSGDSAQRRHHIRRQVKTKLFVASRKAESFFRQCRYRAIDTYRKGQRFSLISHSDYEAAFASQGIRNAHRRSVPSEQISGFHVVCGKCDGFVVRNGAVRNCTHQRDSASSLSPRSRIRGRESSRKSCLQVRNDVEITVQPPTPSSSPELIVRGKCQRSASVRRVDALMCQNGGSAEPQTREPIPAILRPGHDGDRGARTLEYSGEAVSSNTSVPSQHRYTSSSTANDELFLRAGEAARGSRLDRQKVTRAEVESDDNEEIYQLLCGSEAVLERWRDWSDNWEISVTGARSGTDNADRIDRSQCDPDSLIQEWRDFSERWERSLRNI